MILKCILPMSPNIEKSEGTQEFNSFFSLYVFCLGHMGPY